MSGVGNCFDNAVAESFFATLKKELVHRVVFATRTEAYDAIAAYIDQFYNRSDGIRRSDSTRRSNTNVSTTRRLQHSHIRPLSTKSGQFQTDSQAQGRLDITT
jgi:hypothetical protein